MPLTRRASPQQPQLQARLGAGRAPGNPRRPFPTSSFQAGASGGLGPEWGWGLPLKQPADCNLKFASSSKLDSAADRPRNRRKRTRVYSLSSPHWSSSQGFLQSPHRFLGGLEEGWAGRAGAGTAACNAEGEGESAPVAGAWAGGPPTEAGVGSMTGLTALPSPPPCSPQLSEAKPSKCSRNAAQSVSGLCFLARRLRGRRFQMQISWLGRLG